MTERQFSSKVATQVGFPLMEILALIQMLMPILQNLPCFKKADKAQMGIAEAFQAVRKRKGDRVPARVAARMKTQGYTSKAVRERLWDAMCEVAFDNSKEVAAAMV